ncbi:unnamed protein product [Somion occarium]|uniref:Uncharacterized protein n=1 Tax=Somion occarium TaxID=3059160 RepID=A0ABP1DUI7_9APHY
MSFGQRTFDVIATLNLFLSPFYVDVILTSPTVTESSQFNLLSTSLGLIGPVAYDSKGPNREIRRIRIDTHLERSNWDISINRFDPKTPQWLEANSPLTKLVIPAMECATGYPNPSILSGLWVRKPNLCEVREYAGAITIQRSYLEALRFSRACALQSVKLKYFFPPPSIHAGKSFSTLRSSYN